MKTRIIALALIPVLALTLFASCADTETADTPLTAAELLDLGDKYLLELNYEKAIVYFTRLLEIEPMNPRGYTGLAEAYIGLGDTESALAILEQGAEALPGDADIAELLETVAAAPEPTAKPPEETPTPPEPTEEPTPTTTVSAGDIMQLGGHDWRVLEVRDGRALLLSDLILERMRYHDTWEAITWEYSDIRNYLNGEFYNNTFSAEERAQIAETRVVNNDNPWYGTVGGSDTSDKIFLLSIEEVVRYFGDSGQLRNRPSGRGSIEDEYNSARIAIDGTSAVGAVWWWWLRSPGTLRGAARVDSDGTIVVVGSDVQGYAGVRPALWLNL